MSSSSPVDGEGRTGTRRLLGGALRRQRRDTTTSTLLVVGHQLSEAAVPVVVGLAIDAAVATGDVDVLLRWLAAVAGTFVVLATCGGIGYWLLSRAEYAVRRDLRLDLVARAVDPRGGLGGAHGHSGDLVGTAGTDAARTATVVEVVALVAGPGAALVAGAVVLLDTSLVLALTVLVGALAVLVGSQLLARPLVGRAEREQEGLAAATAVATDLVTGLRVLQGIGAEPAAARSYERTSRVALAARLHAVRLEGAYDGLAGLLTGAFLVAVTYVGGSLALDGDITVGQLVAAIGLAQFLMEPLQTLAALAPIFAGARGAARRVALVVETPYAVPDATGALALSGPAVGLVARRGGLVVEAAPGEHVGVVVTDDARAGDLLATLGREDDAGSVLVDGTDLASVTLDEARRCVVVARHDAVLFEGTLAEAVLGVDGEVPAAVLEASAADDVVAALGHRLDTSVGERGRQLSGGQRQRLLLARALATGAPVLVLHDPTTAVDAVTEDRIAAGVRRHRDGRTTLLVTSSPTLLARCDRVLLVRGEAVVASGTHDGLLDDPDYRAAVLS